MPRTTRSRLTAAAFSAVVATAVSPLFLLPPAASAEESTATADALAERFARRIFPGEPDSWARFDAVASPLPAGMPLLVVHDRNDREVGVGEAVRLHDAHGERSRLVLTSGSGHSRVLGADAALDAITAFVTGGPAGVDAAGLGRAAAASARP